LRRPPAPSPGVSWRSEDSSPIGIGRTWVPPDPHGVLTPSGFTPARACDQPKPIAAPRALSRPFRGPSPQPRTEPHDPGGRRPMLPLLSFSALRHDLRTVDPFAGRRIPPSPRATSGVWLPPSRRPPPSLPAREAPEHPWASPFEVSPRRGGAPFEASALRAFSQRAHPPKRAGGCRRLQGLVLATWPGSDPCGPDPRTSLGFSPPESSLPSSGRSLCFAMPTLTPFGRYTFLPTWVSGLCGTTGSACPSRDCRLSWGFAPSDRHGAPFTVAGGGLMVSPRAGPRLRAPPRSEPPCERCS